MYNYDRDRLPIQPVLKPSAGIYRRTSRIDHPATPPGPILSGPGRLQSDRAKAARRRPSLAPGGKLSDKNVLKDSSIVALLAGSFPPLLSGLFASLLTGLFDSHLVTCSCFALLFKVQFLHG